MNCPAPAPPPPPHLCCLCPKGDPGGRRPDVRPQEGASDGLPEWPHSCQGGSGSAGSVFSHRVGEGEVSPRGPSQPQELVRAASSQARQRGALRSRPVDHCRDGKTEPQGDDG